MTPTSKSANRATPVHFIGINKSQAMQLSMGLVILAFIGGSIFEALTNVGPIHLGLRQSLLAGIAYCVALILHELTHGASFKYFGGHPTYGAGVTGKVMPYFYATSVGSKFSVNQMYIIGISPFVLLSVLFAAGGIIFTDLAELFAVAFIGNFSGAIGDLWLMKELTRFRKFKGVSVVDTKAGLEIYSIDPAAKKFADSLDAKAQNSVNFGPYWFFATVGLFIFSTAFTIVAAKFTNDLTIGPSWFPLVDFHESAEGIVYTVNMITPIVGGLLFALLAKLFMKPKMALAAQKSKTK